MGDNDRSARKHWWIAGTLLCVGLAVVLVPRLAETNPVELGVSQPPLVTIIFDTSGGMEWTEEGEGFYPSWNDDDYGAVGTNHMHRWKPGADLNLPGSARRDPSQPGGYAPVTSNASNRIDKVGPCKVWHPMTNATGSSSQQCQDYARPPTCGTVGGCDYSHHFTSGMQERLERMRNDTRFRLTQDSNKPRHIQVKEILTGDMYLTDSSGNITDGPGCWFVPRARTIYNNEQICCSDIDDDDGCVGDGIEAFESYVDFRDPVPHFQEVYDGQHPTGLLDRLASTSIFSVAMFDGFADDGLRDDGWRYPMQDVMAGSSPFTEPGMNIDWQTSNPAWQDPSCDNEGDYPNCHDMGLFRVAGPTSLHLDDGDLIRVARHVQQAVLDAGFLIAHDNPDDVDTLSRNVENDDGEVAEIDVFPYPIGQQPIAEATPFGAAFHDLHQFYIHGQRHGTDINADESNPVMDDEYLSCRGRHTVLFTDGLAEPEAPGGAGGELGSDRVTDPSHAFGYRPEMFPYLTAEEAIGHMIDQVTEEMESNFDGDVDRRFFPRVHVMGVGVEGAGTTAEDVDNEIDVDDGLYAEVLDKIAALAMAGKTCAQYFLPPEMVPEFDNRGNRIVTGQRGPNGEIRYGECDLNGDDVCLLPQDIQGGDFNGYMYEPNDPEESLFLCEHPAVVLSKADRDALTEAFQLIFNEIAGASGLASRSRPAMTSYLDDEDRIGQYRFYSGLEAGGDNPHYRGLLNRQLLECGDAGEVEADGGDPVPLHEEMMRLRGDVGMDDDALDDLFREPVNSDRRRVFTSIPEFVVRYPDDDPAGGDMELLGGSAAETESDFFNTTYRLISAAGGSDQFGEFKISGVSDGSYPSEEVNTRVPFDYAMLTTTFQQAFGTSGSTFENEFYDYWNIAEDIDPTVTREDTMRTMIDDYRARTAYRSDRVLGAIYNSTPVAVGPPDLDLAIDSYREFRRDYAERPTMIYVTTVDGQLRAIHSGEPEVMVKQTAEEDNTDDDSAVASENTREQREAWAYIPQLLHRQLAASSGGTSTDGLMDGSPVVKDVRLCQRGEAYSTNRRVCPSTNTRSEWRTVLVQGMGLAGSGYFALDVTRSGASDNRENPEMPDPIPLWEFGPDWEGLQIQGMNEWRYGPSEDHSSSMDATECQNRLENVLDGLGLNLGDGNMPEDIWQLPFLGTTVGEPAIGTVSLEVNGQRIQRPVAVVGAGTSAGANPTLPFGGQDLSACVDVVTGRAIYVIDLQSGEMIRRFVDYRDNGWSHFESDITGTPVLSGANPADVSTRGFVGDEQGRMFRIDLTSADPREWEVGLFFDPAEDDEIVDGLGAGESLGPAAFRPAVARGMNRQLVLIYGLGHRGDVGADEDTVQAVLAIEESFRREDDDVIVEPKPLWGERFESGERLTGEPVVFNSDVYFTTYVEEQERCLPGTSRMYRLAYDGVDPADPPADPEADNCCESVGRWDPATVTASVRESDILMPSEDPAKWFGPRDPTMIRGMAITMGPTCELTGDDALGSASTPRQPQMVAQTGGAEVGSADDAGDAPGAAGGGSVGGIGHIAVDLEPPRTRSIPMSWSVIEH